jgi:hypothetical protein
LLKHLFRADFIPKFHTSFTIALANDCKKPLNGVFIIFDQTNYIMSLKSIIKRELEVAFAKETQPIWFRILKYVFLICVIYLLWATISLLITLAALFAGALLLHFWIRHKTHGWTKSYGLWKHEGDRPGNNT